MNTTTATTTATHTAKATSTKRPARTRRGRTFLIAAATLAVVGALFGAGQAAAEAQVTIIGNTFSTGIECGGPTMYVHANTSLDSVSYDKVYVYSHRTGRWTVETNWHKVGMFSGFRMAEFTFAPGYYDVYMDYMQLDAAGNWHEGGEYIQRYTQHVGLATYARSTTCRMN